MPGIIAWPPMRVMFCLNFFRGAKSWRNGRRLFLEYSRTTWESFITHGKFVVLSEHVPLLRYEATNQTMHSPGLRPPDDPHNTTAYLCAVDENTIDNDDKQSRRVTLPSRGPHPCQCPHGAPIRETRVRARRKPHHDGPTNHMRTGVDRR